MTMRSEELQAIDEQVGRMTLRRGRPATEERRFAKILVAVDGSPGTARALAWAERIGKLERSNIHLVSAIGPPPTSFDSGDLAPIQGSVSSWRELVAQDRDAAARVLGSARERLRRAALDATVEVAMGAAASVISAIAKDRSADLVICGSHGGGDLERLVLGSVADGLKHHAPCAVLVAKGEPSARNVLLPTDGSSLSRVAIRTGLRLARDLGARAVVLHVVHGTGRKELLQKGYDEAKTAAGVGEDEPPLPAGVTSMIAFGEAHKVIVEQADAHESGLIVMGSRGLGGIGGRLLGSVSNPVSNNARCSLLVIKPVE